MIKMKQYLPPHDKGLLNPWKDLGEGKRKVRIRTADICNYSVCFYLKMWIVMINMNCDPTLRVMLGGLPSVKAYSSVITRPSWGVHSPTLMDNLFSEDYFPAFIHWPVAIFNHFIFILSIIFSAINCDPSFPDPYLGQLGRLELKQVQLEVHPLPLFELDRTSQPVKLHELDEALTQ